MVGTQTSENAVKKAFSKRKLFFIVRQIPARALTIFVAMILASCDEGTQVGRPDALVAGFKQLDGKVHAVADKSLFHTMEMVIQAQDPFRSPEPDATEPWFTLDDGDRIRVISVDEEDAIAQVEIVTGVHSGLTCWISLDCVITDD